MCYLCHTLKLQIMQTTESNKKVSLIVPFYNVENYIAECFHSIAAQTYTGPLECLFIDDCGTDRGGILTRLTADYHGDIDFQIIPHDHNRGISAARNTGIAHATGDYLFFLDSDDSITPDCIEQLCQVAMRHPGVEMVQGDTLSVNPYVTLPPSIKQEYYDDAVWIKRTCLNSTLPVTVWNKLVRRDFVLRHNLYFREGVIHEDELWMFYVAQHLQSLSICHAKTYVYRDNANGIMRTHGAESYDAVVLEMSQHLSHPCIGYELSNLSNGTNVNQLDIPYSRRVLHWLFYLRKMAYGTTADSLRGRAYRMAYHALIRFIDLTYPRTT